ncbi:MAG: aldehyde dehydrogenase (NADP(+)) [Bacteroidota bacterium]
MLHGHNFIGVAISAEGRETLRNFSTLKAGYLPNQFHTATADEVNRAIAKAIAAHKIYSKTDFMARAVFLETIAEQIVSLGDELLERAHVETGLPMARLTGERGRTVGQLQLFASLLREGSWADCVIDTAMPDRKPLPRADLRRMLQALGPVAVFGASNFPFAFSTAGGDTASALAAGCPVIVKAHTSHMGTNELVAGAVIAAAKLTGMPDGVFSSLNGEGVTIGQKLAADPAIKAIGFTGSYRGGMALFRTATQVRKEPIPVYAEMSSINPVVLLPGLLSEKKADAALAQQIAGSISLGVGQFCTNPGLLFVIENDATEQFSKDLGNALSSISAEVMLNAGICKSYYEGRNRIESIKSVEKLFAGPDASADFKASPALYKIQAAEFIQQTNLHEEVFGPCSMMVICKDTTELVAALECIGGQLTGSVFGQKEELSTYEPVIDTLKQKVGRLIFNAMPTGVEVCHAMVHGGPFPATTDARSTSVGTEAIRRFVRPVCYQDTPQELLPVYLQNENKAGVMRKLNGVLTRDAIVS